MFKPRIPLLLRDQPFQEIGAKATADYHGNAIGIHSTPKGAQLLTAFQKLSGTVTREGLRLESTADKGGGLHFAVSWQHW